MSTPDKRRRLEEIVGRCNSASTGPWRMNISRDGYGVIPISPHGFPVTNHGRRNANFVIHSREDIPWLCSELDIAWRRIQELEQRLGYETYKRRMMERGNSIY